jgi:membrane dipeptidase
VMNLTQCVRRFHCCFDHLDYIVKLIGVDHVGIGSDFDGITSPAQQLNDVTDFPLITKELVKRGYSKKNIKKILGENFIRVLKANEEKISGYRFIIAAGLVISSQ